MKKRKRGCHTRAARKTVNVASSQQMVAEQIVNRANLDTFSQQIA
jgi:hypothetical protein